MPAAPQTIPALLDRLETLYGPPPRPKPRKALDWILWENCAYLVPDAKRAQAYAALKAATKLTAKGIQALPRGRLRELAALGGMMPDGRVAKLVAIAELVQERFDGDLEQVLVLPEAKARAALKRFPGIGAPGADRILLFTGAFAVPALESNGLRVLVRLGHAREGKGYAQTYRTGVAALEPFVARGAPWLARAYDLLRRHGQELCKNTAPLCDGCPLEERCPSAS